MKLDMMVRKAAQAALNDWNRDQQGLEDLVHDLWVWYLESPATQTKIAESDEFLARRLIHRAALQKLAGQSLSGDAFDGKLLYSTDTVKEALAGKSKNKWLLRVLPFARKNLDNRNEGQAEAVRSRYDDKVTPQAAAAKMLLSRAVQSLTDTLANAMS